MPLPEELIEAELPLTPVQEQLVSMILSRKEPEYTSFGISLPEHASLSFDLIRHAWRAVASHNAVLRTRLEIRGDRKVSVGGRQCVLRHIPDVQFCQRMTLSYSGHETARLVVDTSDNSMQASVWIHRALIDDSSVPLLCKDFDLFFSSIAFSHHASLEKFIQRVISRDRNAAKLFWRAQLAGISSAPIHGLPTETKALLSNVTGVMGKTKTDMLQNFAASANVSVPSVFYTAWASTLAVHTEAGNNRVTFSVFGRDPSSPHNLNVTGPCDQTYPLVISILPDQSAKDLASGIAQADKEASSHAFIGYRSILDQAPESLQQTLVHVRSSRKSFAVERLRSYFDEFALAIDIDTTDETTITIHYNEFVQEAQAHVVLNHFLSAISSVIGDGTQTTKSINLVSPSERGYLLDLAKPLAEPVEGLIHQLFEAQAEKTPDLPAVQFERDACLSYKQLNMLANGVARQLKCNRGSYVPVCMRRSVNLIVALVAILKAGAGYVTLDPDVPARRNNFIFQDVSAAFAITDHTSKGTFPNEVIIEDLIEGAEHRNPTNLLVKQTSDDIAYVIYTSGSTGSPKGVLLEHRAAYSGLAAFPVIQDLRQLLFHNPVFSAAQRSIWSTLKQGGCLCLASKENLTVHIANTINEMEINTIDVTPSTATFIPPGSVPNLSRMTVAGELINPALVPLWADELELMNAYGLSENTQFNWRHIIENGQNPQNIGRPSDTTTSYVLRPGTTELAPILVPGELCLGGHQLARGYLNRPEKTKEVFIDNPFGPGKLYRTGDLVLTCADGSIEMIGRIDFSIKINDQRVDPGESNSIIQLHPQVKDSSVVAASISGRRVLVAVIVPADETNWDRLLPDIRKQLEDHLPLYMIPSYWLTRKDLPLNINGKVDVPALSKICEDMGRNGLMQRPRESQNQDGEEFSTEEKIVRDLFADALSINPANIARHDSFLTIGGTSLDAIKVSSAAFKLDLQIHTVQILQGGSISELAKASSPQNGLEVESPSEPFSLAPQNFPIDSSEVEDIFPATPLQEGLIADSILMKTDYMFLKLFSLEGLPLSELKNAFQIVMDERSLYRTTFVAHGTSFLQLIRKHIDLPWENFAIDLPTYLHRKRGASDFVALHAPLLRVVVLNQDIVVVETHHALVDSWSYNFLFEDVRTVLSGKKLDVRPSFRKYIEHLGTQQKEPSYQFWKEYMKGARPILLETTEHGAFFSEIEIDFDLKAIESSNPSTAAALLYASWAVILSSWTSSDDVVFIVNVSGREAPLKDILTINGPTLSTAPMRVGIDSRATVRQLAQQLVPEFWKLAEHSHIGLRNILRATGLSSGLANTAANYLISMESSQATQGLEPFFLKYQNATDLITIEVENRNLGRMKMFSNKGLVAADAILADMRDVLRAAVQEPRTTIGELRSRVGPRQQPPQEPAMKMPEFSSPTAVQEHSSSESQSPVTNPVFDKQDLPITGLSTPRTESLSENQERSLKSIFEAWKEYLTDSETTILDHSPQELSTVMKSIPSVVLKSAAAKLGVSQEAILYAAWGIILGRHTNVSNPLFGVICSGINNWVQYSQDSLHFVPQRLALGTDLSLRQIFTAVERDLVNRPEASELNLEQALDFSDHHSIAFDSLVKLQFVGDESTTSQPSLVQFYGRQGLKYTMLDIMTAGNQTTFKLSSRISEERGECILDELSNVIQAAVTVPSTVLRSFNMIGERERNMLHELAHFTTLEADLVHSRFEKFAREKPHKLALQFETSEYVTYKELNERANRLARHLMSIGVGPEQMVPLYLDKSVEMIVAILAVLKAGAAYVPLSPDNPSRRNLFILDEVRARFVITQTWYKDFDSHHGATSVFVDHLPRLDQVSALDTGAGNVDSLAYCIYTSGSTGTPKGVNVSHRAISIAVQGMTTDEGIKSDWKHLLFANYTFDVSVHDIFTILGCGGTLCVASTERMISDLAGVINEMEVTQTFLTPTVARLISPEQVPRVETLLCSGEALTADIIEAWSPHRTLINLYGPTECAVNATVGYIRPDTKPTALGKPICTASIMVVVVGGPDLAPLGAIGEICIAGGHVAEGYMNRDDLTSKVFTSSPIPGIGRMYRTGDLGRWLPGGKIEYLGRMDDQIKLNGHRIELGEIEQVILKSGLVQDCVAMVLNTLARPQIAAFCVFGTSTDTEIQKPEAYKPRINQLKESLGSLAHYMVPKTVFPMGRFPRSAANKTDRKNLKRMAEALDAESFARYSLAAAPEIQEGTLEEPKSKEERLLRHIWSDLFQIDKSLIGATTNFGALGGDSIAAINLVSACRKEGYSISVNDVLKTGTLKGVALHLKSASGPNRAQTHALKKYEPPNAIINMLEARGTQSHDIDYIYPCPPGQTEFLNQGSRDHQSWVVTAVRPFAAHHSTESYMKLIQQLTCINDILRTTFTKVPGHGWIGVVFKQPVINFAMRWCDFSEKDRIVDEIKKRRFVFGEPFVLYVMLKYPDGSQDIVIKMDHGLWDGTSLRIFDEVVLALQASGTAPKNTEFKDFAFDQWRSDKSEALQFWAKTVQEKERPLPHTTNPATNCIFNHVVDSKFDVNRLARARGITAAIVFQGVFQLWLAEMTGFGEASYDYLLTGRNVDLANPQSINGTCANFLPFRIPINRNQTLASFLSETQDFFWQATDYGNVGLSDIFTAAHVDREEMGNRILFLFQPFEPASGPQKSEMRWVVLAQSQAHMTQPYALVEEVHKTVNGYKIVIKYDDKVYTTADIEEFLKRQTALLEHLLETEVEEARLNDII